MRVTALLLSLTLTEGADNLRAMRMLNDWIGSVDRHVAGERDEALAQIGRWTIDDLDLMRGYVEAFAHAPSGVSGRADRRREISSGDLTAITRLTETLQARGSFDTFRTRAALLHTDAAMLEPSPTATGSTGSRRNAPTQTFDVTNLDGRVEGIKVANPHWQFAMDLLDSLPATPQRQPVVAQWYRAIGAHFARQHSYGDAFRHFERARKIVPDDPDVLFGDACLEETLGSPAEQNFARLAKLPPGLVLIGVGSPEAHFRRAEGMLSRAIAARPGFVDARLRLGRVLAGQRKYEAALPHFSRVIADSADPVLTYYAHLFAGDAALALGRPADSLASYEKALSAFPNAQAARLGLGAALRAAGQRQAAVDAIMTTLTVEPRTRDAVDDPWWQYYEGDAANVDRLLDELRAPFKAIVQ